MTWHTTFASLSLLMIGCLDSSSSIDDDGILEEGEDVEADGQGATFPPLPDDSCRAGLPMTCPTSTTYTITYPNSHITKRTSTITLSRTNVAGFTSRGTNELCTASQDVVIGGIEHFGARLPAGITAEISPDRKGVWLRGGTVTGGMVIPPQWPFNTYCAGMCDDTGMLPPGCRDAPTVPSTVTVATSGSAARQVRVTGTVDTMSVSPTGELKFTCKWTVPRNALFTTQTRRPNDVISTSNRLFVRGFDLKGSALTNACTNFASAFVCLPTNPADAGSSAVQRCISDTAASCQDTFTGTDPCACLIKACTRNDQCVSNSCVSGCCTPVIR